MPAPSSQPDLTGAATAKKPVRTRYERGIWTRETSDGTLRYEYAWQDRHGRRHWGTCATLADARRERAAKYARRPEERVAADRRLTFTEVSEQWYEAKARTLRPRTRDYYADALRLVLVPRFGRLPVSKIDADAIAELVRDLEAEGLHALDADRPKRPLGRASIVNYLRPLQGTLAFAARRGYITSNPWLLLTREDMPRRRDDEEERRAHEWTGDELARLLAASQQLAVTKGAPEARPYDYSSLLLVTATLGLRLGEVLGLKWADFVKGEDANSGLLHVRQQWLRTHEYGPCKTRAGKRTLALPGDLRAELLALKVRSSYSRDEDPIFASRAGTPLAHRNVTRRGFEAARDLAGLPKSLRFHDLRHAAASRLIAAGVDDVVVADQLGHGDSRITRSTYAHVYDRKAKMDAVRVALTGVAVTEG